MIRNGVPWDRSNVLQELFGQAGLDIEEPQAYVTEVTSSTGSKTLGIIILDIT
jgi:hypothetical protein